MTHTLLTALLKHLALFALPAPANAQFQSYFLANYNGTGAGAIQWLDVWNEQVQDLLAPETAHQQHPIAFPAVFVEIINLQIQDGIGYQEADATVVIHIVYQTYAETYLLPDTATTAVSGLPQGANDTLTEYGGTGAGLLPFLYLDLISEYLLTFSPANTTTEFINCTQTATNTTFYRTKSLHHFTNTYTISLRQRPNDPYTIPTLIPDGTVTYDQTIPIPALPPTPNDFIYT